MAQRSNGWSGGSSFWFAAIAEGATAPETLRHNGPLQDATLESWWRDWLASAPKE